MKKFIDFCKSIIILGIIAFIGFYVSTNMELPTETANEVNSYSEISEVDVSGKYYYNQLDEYGKIIYGVIENNVSNMKSGTYVLNIDNDKISDKLKAGGQEEVITAFHSAWNAYAYDCPDTIFWLDINKLNLTIECTKNIIYSKYKVKIEPDESGSYLIDGITADRIDVMRVQLQNKKKEIIDSLYGTTYDKLKQVHDYIVKNCEYKEGGTNQYNLYGCLIEGKSVCEGYAEAYKYILDELGIDCVMVSGTGINSQNNQELHVWNYVYFSQKWYAVDVTWDDPIIIGNSAFARWDKYDYFMKGSKEFNKNHFAEKNISEHAIEFEYPELSESNYR